MCLVIGLFLVAFGWVIYPDSAMMGMGSLLLGGVMFTVFVVRFWRYQRKKD